MSGWYGRVAASSRGLGLREHDYDQHRGCSPQTATVGRTAMSAASPLTSLQADWPELPVHDVPRGPGSRRPDLEVALGDACLAAPKAASAPPFLTTMGLMFNNEMGDRRGGAEVCAEGFDGSGIEVQGGIRTRS